ncbi:unnamed protein product [Arabidopsis thaliana]|uniref:Uncharacterized protein n=4 Tax=Arabidopsis TaxID=3701 RepID=A0A654E6B4_ARATH|nr:uncharacterized protein AT1G02320 [Arabidopsis thaliana]KAG7644794.1 hypothetical protein ISN45_At01g001430 [Arabidopsis thaliana x Arabidopsis arenosa]KAG7652797.1 hypothetical protein ISN44_As01g001320 [Arabidopsis suecica]AEE27415.1 hypothetical protein AT1G02320 [Arabidopsis thaliana]CAA0156598.1 unnamed protein product [Arabidopsis thaliana]VYS44756.1 unnamed protein product [Arabidopsis thaliana]|eukprot:NP_171734.1 hypothetical protein AT1G02320 [Arabidopsis thaliana]
MFIFSKYGSKALTATNGKQCQETGDLIYLAKPFTYLNGQSLSIQNPNQ